MKVSLFIIIFARWKTLFITIFMKSCRRRAAKDFQCSEGHCICISVKQVYNRNARLFNTELKYERGYQNVRFFLWAQSCKPSSPFMGTANRGWYALKPNVCRQMRIDFTESPSEEAVEFPEKEERSMDYPTLF